MNRLMIAVVFALLASACVDPGGPGGGYSYGPVDCRRFTSCATCTPVLGCGWCSMGTKGACVDQPNACATASNFYWTWELSGCPGAGDAGTSVPADAGANAGTDADAGAVD
jgi:plexin-like protein